MRRTQALEGARLPLHHRHLHGGWGQGRQSAVTFQHSPRGWGWLQRNWRPVATQARGQGLTLQGRGICSSSRFILRSEGPCVTIRRALKISKWILAPEAGRWSKAGHREKKASNSSEYYFELNEVRTWGLLRLFYTFLYASAKKYIFLDALMSDLLR